MIEELPDERIVSFEAAKQYLQISDRTLRDLAADRHRSGKRIPAIRVSNRQVNFYVRDLKQFAQESYTG